MTSPATHAADAVGPQSNALRRIARKAASIGRRLLRALVPFGAAVAALYPVAFVIAMILIGEFMAVATL